MASLSSIQYSYAGKVNRRRSKRMNDPEMEICVGLDTYPVLDWSLSGFRAGGLTSASLEEDTEVWVQVATELKGTPLNARIRAIVTWVDVDAGEFAARFIEIEDHAWSVLEQLATRRLRRQAAAE